MKLLAIALLLVTATLAENSRKPTNDADLRYWLENMITHHNFSPAEIRAATSLSETEIAAATNRFKTKPFSTTTTPARAADGRLKILPYPGGRHPRIGFLDGAIDPQRETKFSLFLPWDPASYVVVDVPEAIWSNLGLTYLAHTHVPTIWTQQKIDLEKLEWQRHPDGRLTLRRKLPSNIEFGTDVTPHTNHIAMKFWLKNGTDKTLADLRLQNCVMLKSAAGFNAQTNTNKILRPEQNLIAAHNTQTNRWIVTTWTPLHRAWANPPVPCIHADPKLPDAAPGATVEATGQIWFHEGSNVDSGVESLRNKILFAQPPL